VLVTLDVVVGCADANVVVGVVVMLTDVVVILASE